MLVAVFAAVHAHADALEAVIAAADARGVDELWSLGDMVGGGPDPERVVARVRERCAVALMGNHDYAATGAVEPARLAEPGSPAFRSIELARRRRAASEGDPGRAAGHLHRQMAAQPRRRRRTRTATPRLVGRPRRSGRRRRVLAPARSRAAHGDVAARAV